MSWTETECSPESKDVWHLLTARTGKERQKTHRKAIFPVICFRSLRVNHFELAGQFLQKKITFFLHYLI